MDYDNRMQHMCPKCGRAWKHKDCSGEKKLIPAACPPCHVGCVRCGISIAVDHMVKYDVFGDNWHYDESAGFAEWVGNVKRGIYGDGS